MKNLDLKSIVKIRINLFIAFILVISVTLQAESVKSKTINTNNLLEVNVLDVVYTNSYMIHGRFKQEPSNPSAKFVTILFEIENISGENLQNFAPILAAKVVDQSGYTYSALASGQSDRLPTMKSLFAKQKIKGTITFEIPANTKIIGILWDGFPYTNSHDETSIQIKLMS